MDCTSPCGTKVGTASHAIHHDEDIYENATTYQPFRFSQAREELSAKPCPKKEHHDGEIRSRLLRSASLSAVTTSDTFLPFGHGRHACPGRFFASTQIKMLLAYIIMNYDIEPKAARPANRCVGQTIVPPLKATLSVRRRKF